MKRIKSFKLFESQDRIESVMQEIEDILISGGIKDIGYRFEVKKGIPDSGYMASGYSERINIYIRADKELISAKNSIPEEIIESLERVIEFSEGEGFSHTIGCYGGGPVDPMIVYDSISDVGNKSPVSKGRPYRALVDKKLAEDDTIVLILKK